MLSLLTCFENVTKSRGLVLKAPHHGEGPQTDEFKDGSCVSKHLLLGSWTAVSLMNMSVEGKTSRALLITSLYCLMLCTSLSAAFSGAVTLCGLTDQSAFMCGQQSLQLLVSPLDSSFQLACWSFLRNTIKKDPTKLNWTTVKLQGCINAVLLSLVCSWSLIAK